MCGNILDLKVMSKDPQLLKNDCLNQYSDLFEVLGLQPKKRVSGYIVEDVHESSSNAREVQAQGIKYLREKTPSIQFKKNYEEDGRNETATKEECRKFYDEYLKPILIELLEGLDAWKIETSETHEFKNDAEKESFDALVEQRNKDREILKQYLPQLIKNYQQSPSDLASEEIVRLYTMKKAEDEEEGKSASAVFAVYSVLLECYNAYDDNASCKEGIMERIRRDAGIFVASKENHQRSISLKDYYAAIINGFLNEDGKPGLYLRKLTALAILEEFGITGSIGESIEYIDIEVIEKLWPKIENDLEEYAKKLGLSWAAARFSNLKGAQQALLEAMLVELGDINTGVEEAKEDLHTAIILGCFSRASLDTNDTEVLEEASKLAGESLKMNMIRKGELRQYKRLKVALELKKRGMQDLSSVMDGVKKALIEKKLLNDLEDLPWEENVFKDLEIPIYDVKQSCMDNKTLALIFASALQTVGINEKKVCLSSKHIKSWEAWQNIEVNTFQNPVSGSVDSIVAVIDRKMEKKQDEKAKDYFESVIVDGYMCSSSRNMPEQLVELYHRYTVLQEKIRTVESWTQKEALVLAYKFKDDEWLKELSKDIPYIQLDTFVKNGAIFSSKLAGCLFDREVKANNLSIEEIVNLAVISRDGSRLKQMVDKMTKEELESGNLKQLIEKSLLSSDKGLLTEEMLEAYCNKLELIEINNTTPNLDFYRRLMNAGYGRKALRSRCKNEVFSWGYIIEQLRLTGKNIRYGSRKDFIQWIEYLIGKMDKIDCGNLEDAIKIQTYPEISMMLIERVGNEKILSYQSHSVNSIFVLACQYKLPNPVIRKLINIGVLSGYQPEAVKCFFENVKDVQDLGKQVVKIAVSELSDQDKVISFIKIMESVRDEALLKYFLEQLEKDEIRDMAFGYIFKSKNSWSLAVMIEHSAFKQYLNRSTIKLVEFDDCLNGIQEELRDKSFNTLFNSIFSDEYSTSMQFESDFLNMVLKDGYAFGNLSKYLNIIDMDRLVSAISARSNTLVEASVDRLISQLLECCKVGKIFDKYLESELESLIACVIESKLSSKNKKEVVNCVGIEYFWEPWNKRIEKEPGDLNNLLDIVDVSFIPEHFEAYKKIYGLMRAPTGKDFAKQSASRKLANLFVEKWPHLSIALDVVDIKQQKHVFENLSKHANYEVVQIVASHAIETRMIECLNSWRDVLCSDNKHALVVRELCQTLRGEFWFEEQHISMAMRCGYPEDCIVMMLDNFEGKLSKEFEKIAKGKCSKQVMRKIKNLMGFRYWFRTHIPGNLFKQSHNVSSASFKDNKISIPEELGKQGMDGNNQEPRI